MPRIKSETVVIWAAVSPEGQIVISSISAYYSVAYRWSLKYRNHSVRKVTEIDRYVDESAPTRAEIRAENRATASEEVDPEHDEIQIPKTNGKPAVLPPPRKRRVRQNRKVAQ